MTDKRRFWVLTDSLGAIPWAEVLRRRDLFPGAVDGEHLDNPATRGAALLSMLREEYVAWQPFVYRLLAVEGERTVQLSRDGRWVDLAPPLRSDMPAPLLDAAIEAVQYELGVKREWFLPVSSPYFAIPTTD